MKDSSFKTLDMGNAPCYGYGMEIMKVNGGRTGRKVHYAMVGSSVLGCGKWVKFDLRHVKVSDDAEVTCEKCKASDWGAAFVREREAAK